MDRIYESPHLTYYGRIEDITRSTVTVGNDSAGSNRRPHGVVS
mgnify:CR=1 FL=1